MSVGAALVAGGQAASNVLADTMPALSVRLSPYAARAYENLAAGGLREAGTRDPNVRFDPTVTLSHARSALDRGPLSPRAVVILGLAETDAEKQGRIFDAASRLSKRDKLLQGILLQYYTKRQDLTQTLGTLDRLFKAHPQMSGAAMPILTSQLANSESEPVFRDLLKDGPSWTNDFLRHAARDKALAQNLARLRLSLGRNAAVEPDTDRMILASLAAAGELEEAHSIYRLLQTSLSRATTGETIDWRHDLPPFDWRLRDEPGYYARVNASASAVEIAIRSGHGGILAERIVSLPPAAVALRIEHEIEPVAQLGDIRLSLSCASNSGAGIEVALHASPMRWDLKDLPANCSFYRLTISGRAWSNKANLAGFIRKIDWLSRTDR